jgi:hypothetical protein
MFMARKKRVTFVCGLRAGRFLGGLVGAGSVVGIEGESSRWSRRSPG